MSLKTIFSRRNVRTAGEFLFAIAVFTLMGFAMYARDVRHKAEAVQRAQHEELVNMLEEQHQQQTYAGCSCE